MLRQRNPGTQFPSRLTKLYSETKNSCNTVSVFQNVEDGPELLCLHRDYCIQKDRLTTWGLEWTDYGDDKAIAQGNIDLSVARAGLTETITNVLGHVKDVLDEAERINREHSTPAKSSEKSRSQSVSQHSWTPADKSHYGNLVADLTTSLDVLYELSAHRARRTSQASTLFDHPVKKDRELSIVSSGVSRPHFKSPFGSLFNTSELTLVNSLHTSTTLTTNFSPTDASTRQRDPGPDLLKLDLDSLILPQEEPPPYPGENIGLVPPVRLIGQLGSSHVSTTPGTPEGAKDTTEAVLIEYARFDPIFRDTGVPPPLQNLESLNGLLQNLKSLRSEASGTLSLIGYFDDENHSRIGLVYRLPETIEALDFGQDVRNQIDTRSDRRPASLLSLLQLGQNRSTAPVTPLFQPTLEDRFRLAFNVASALRRMHDKNVVHGDFNSAGIIFFKAQQQRHDRSVSFDIRLPYVTAFDVFSDCSVDAPPARSWSPRNIYLHPEGTSKDARTDIDPRTRLDIYGLGLILLEIGLWTPLIEIFKPKYTLGEFKLRLQNIWAKRLASKCGSLYMKCVLDCLSAGDDNPLTKATTNEVYSRILGRLARCCALDEAEPVVGGDWQAHSLQHAATYDGTTARARDSQELEQPRPILFPRHSGGHIGEKHDWNPFHKLRHPIESLHRPHTLASIPSAASTLPLAYAGIASPPITQEPLDMTSERVEELQKELAKKEIAIEDLQRSHNAILRDIEADRRRHSNFELARNTSIHDFEANLPFKPSEIVHGAAKTIQSAWRNRMGRQRSNVSTSSSPFTEYRRKVTLIQKQWRERQAQRSQTGTERDQLEEVDLTGNNARSLDDPQSILGGLQTAEPEVHEIPIGPLAEEVAVTQWSHQEEISEKKKLRVYPVKLSSTLLNDWHQRMGPQLMRILERALRDSPETSSVDLVGMGESQYSAKPTIFITCSSVGKVKAAINRKFDYDKDVFDVKIRKGKIRRSHAKRRAAPVLRSMMNGDGDSDGDGDGDSFEAQAVNPRYYKRPLCGASIGAFRGEHLPAVSYGGVIVVDGKPFGMSVHHLLDVQSDTESEDDEEYSESPNNIPVRSSAPYNEQSHLAHIGSAPSLLEIPDEIHPLEISDYSSEEEDLNGYYSEGSEDSDIDPLEVPPRAPSVTGSTSTSFDDEFDNTGDTPGISPHDKTRIPITQPALDDVPAQFFPSPEERDDEHLLSHKFGYVYASSGVRRVSDPVIQGMRHEVDWALFQLDPPRLQPYNVIQGGRRWREDADNIAGSSEPNPTLVEPVSRSSGYEPKEDLYPVQVSSMPEVAGQQVCSFGRTSGLKLGQMGQAMSCVKIWGRKTFSWEWGVFGGFGVGGDSGAWVIETTSGKVCGHVLAYCKEKGIAYISPMDILFDDIKRTLGARKITLPGISEPELVHMAENGEAEELEDFDSIDNDEEEDASDGASEADDEFEDAASWDDDEGTAVSNGNVVEAQLAKGRSVTSDEYTKRKRQDLRIDTPSAAGLGVQLHGLGISAESPPRKEERVLTHRLRDISPPMDRSNAFMPQMVRSPISGGPVR